MKLSPHLFEGKIARFAKVSDWKMGVNEWHPHCVAGSLASPCRLNEIQRRQCRHRTTGEKMNIHEVAAPESGLIGCLSHMTVGPGCCHRHAGQKTRDGKKAQKLKHDY